jgi:formate hydrogenlyase subunit 3/multisubunit Na+/H+ antiporter MnhD subunit
MAMAGSGTLYFLISHGLAKASMFLSAGCIAHAAGSDRLSEFIGIGRYLPVSVFAFALAGVSLMGLPPSGGFVGKWLMLKAAFGTGQWWWAVVMSVGGLLAAAYVFMVLKQAVVFRLVDIRFYEVPAGMQWAALLLALSSLLLGLSGEAPFDLLEIGSPFSAPTSAGSPP